MLSGNERNVSPAELQHRYYTETASEFMVRHDEREHQEALAWLAGWSRMTGIRSILDVGAGTGANVRRLSDLLPGVRVVGLEPVAALREVGHRGGLSVEELVDGDAYRLPFHDGAFDVVCAFAVMHHLARPAAAIDEMVRVARMAVFVSDGNNFSHGSRAKIWLRKLRLWRVAVLASTRGRGWYFSEADGIAFSYSLFQSLDQLGEHGDVRLLTTRPCAHPDLLRYASHVAAMCVKPGHGPSAAEPSGEIASA